MSGGVKNIFVANSTFINAKSGGIRLKSAKGRGGYIKNVTIINCTLLNPSSGALIAMTDDYGGNNP